MSSKRPLEEEGGSDLNFSDTGSRRLTSDFYRQPCESLAKKLLGKIICRRLAGRVLRGRIVETESYLGVTDGASHSYGGRRTPRNAAMFMEPGTVYVYPIYGMYECVNISSLEEGSAVLIRAVEPLAELDLLTANRASKRKDLGTRLKAKDLCNGPSKLCAAFSITKVEFNQQHLADSSTIWLEEGTEHSGADIVTTTRIGIAGAGPEWSCLPLRFYLKNNAHISVRDRNAEKLVI